MIPAYPQDDLWDELVELGAAVHWSLDEVLDLPHKDRLLVLEILDARRRRLGEADHDG